MGLRPGWLRPGADRLSGPGAFARALTALLTGGCGSSPWSILLYREQGTLRWGSGAGGTMWLRAPRNPALANAAAGSG